MKSDRFLRHIIIMTLLSVINVPSAHAESFPFMIEFDGEDYCLESGIDPLTTNLNVGDDITYIFRAAGNNYWETTRDYLHFAFLSVTPPAQGSRTSSGTVTYSFNGVQRDKSDFASFTLAESIAGGTCTLPNQLKFDTVTITSRINVSDDPNPFQINNYQITEMDLDWVQYVHNDTPEAGDVNIDAQIDLADAILSLQIAAGSARDGVHSAGDVNDDGSIGLAEVIYILRSLAAP